MANEKEKTKHLSSSSSPRNQVIMILAEMIKKYGDNVLAKIENNKQN